MPGIQRTALLRRQARRIQHVLYPEWNPGQLPRRSRRSRAPRAVFVHMHEGPDRAVPGGNPVEMSLDHHGGRQAPIGKARAQGGNVGLGRIHPGAPLLFRFWNETLKAARRQGVFTQHGSELPVEIKFASFPETKQLTTGSALERTI